MFDVERLLGQMISGRVSGSKKRGKSNALGIPGVSTAQLGVGAIGIAIAAWEHFKPKAGATGQPTMDKPPPMAPPPPPRAAQPIALPPTPVTAPAPVAAAESEDEARIKDAAHLIRSMIAAANADAVIDADERAGILERAMEAGLDTKTQQFLMGELRAPATLDQIAATTRPELRLETYAAALIAISVDSDAERVYLERLAATLGLSEADVQMVRQQLGIA